MTRVFAWMAAVTTLVAAGAYMVVSLNRWEWNRALFFGLVVLMAEIAIATGLVLSRLPRRAPAGGVDAVVLDVLRETRPPSPNRFEWLDPTAGRTSVFITFLVGGGVVLSAIAWLLDRVAARTTTRVGEVRLARRLSPISHPAGGPRRRRHDGPRPVGAGVRGRPAAGAAAPGRS